jgi:hypothetical protein
VAPATLVSRIPDDSPLYTPTPIALSGIAALDVGSLAAGQDAMDTDLNMAVSGVATEADAQAALNSLLGSFDTATGDTISTRVDQSGASLGSAISTGNGLLGGVDTLVPPSNPAGTPSGGTTPSGPGNAPGTSGPGTGTVGSGGGPDTTPTGKQ